MRVLGDTDSYEIHIPNCQSLTHLPPHGSCVGAEVDGKVHDKLRLPR